METQSVKKRVTCLNIYNQLETYAILLNQKLGQGYFGTVMKAYNQANPYEILAVKVIPFNADKDYRLTIDSIDREIDIICDLGQHPNLVKVLPVKCRSDHNYYIFMEYCEGGTLQSTIKQKLIDRDYFTEPEIFKTFYEVLAGYKVLLQKKILHQDLKPENILIKKGTHKITDFGFSILYEGVKLGHKRQGTLEYMPLEKLTVLDYEANPKSDVYSLGVIFFKMITGRHPYILRQYDDDADFIALLKSAQLRPPAYVRARMSLPMQHMFDLIIKMVAKHQQQRVDFDQIYAYLDEEAEFLAFRHIQDKKHSEIVESEEIQVPEQLESINSRFVEFSTAFAIPFTVMKTEQDTFEEMFRIKNLQMQQKHRFQTLIKIENYLCSMRMMVYFFDRLSRRLTVERNRKQFEQMRPQNVPPTLQLQERVIMYLVFLSLKITKQTLNESPKSSSFALRNSQQWAIYKQGRPNVFDLVKNDQQYLEAQKEQLIFPGTQQSKIHAIKGIIDDSTKPLFEFMEVSVKPCLEELFEARAKFISIDDKKSLVSIFYILTAIQIIENFQEKQQRWEELETYFRQTQTKQICQLRQKVYQGIKKYSLSGCFDEGDWVEQQ